jgi:hypothetical protein
MEWWRSEIFLIFFQFRPPSGMFSDNCGFGGSIPGTANATVLRFAGFQLDQQRAELREPDRTMVEAGLPER